MKCTFLGTRGNIEAKNRRHRLHSSMLVTYYGQSVMIDAGKDWKDPLEQVDPDAIVLTHAHPDHAEGLSQGAPCVVYGTVATWETIKEYGLQQLERMPEREPLNIEGISFEAFPVEHSTRCPAVGYRIEAGRVTVFYVPDVVYIHDRGEAMLDADLYVGDGATLKRSMVRKIGDSLIGHTPVRTQLTWCETEGVPRALFTHCGTDIVEGDERTLGPELRSMARERNVEAAIAYDGLTEVFR